MTERSDLAALSDTALLGSHAAGDPQAFGELFRRHRDRLWAVAVRTVGDREEAADAVQDAFISALRASSPTAAVAGPAAAFRGDSAVTTWLHRIVVNACLDRTRRRKVRHTEPLPDSDDHAPPTRAGEVEEQAEHTDQRTAVLAALRTLPEEQRTALVLVDMEGFSIEEAAQVMDCAPGTVKSRCSRGRARLLPLLAGWRDARPGAAREPTAAHPRPTRAAPSAPVPARHDGAPDRSQEVT